METAPFSIYFDLEETRPIDIEVIARTALALSAATKELAFHFDPTAAVSLDLVSGRAGSFRINALVRLSKKAQKKPLALAISLTLVSWFGQHTFEKLMRELEGAEEVELSHEQMEELAELVAQKIQAKVAQPQITEVYREIKRDQNVDAVGATLSYTKKPQILVPKSKFPIVVEPDKNALFAAALKRNRQRRITAILVAPILEQGNRRWKVRTYEGEFGAAMKDREFQHSVLSGKRRIPTVEGAEMDIELQTTEMLWDGVWHPEEHSILKVYRVRKPARQQDLLLGSGRGKRK